MDDHRVSKQSKVEDFKKAVGQRYEEVVGYASFYIAEVAGGSDT